MSPTTSGQPMKNETLPKAIDWRRFGLCYTGQGPGTLIHLPDQKQILTNLLVAFGRRKPNSIQH